MSESYFLRLPEVIRRCGIKKSKIYQMIKNGTFPNSYVLGPRSCAWKSDEIQSWIDSRQSSNNEKIR